MLKVNSGYFGHRGLFVGDIRHPSLGGTMKKFSKTQNAELQDWITKLAQAKQNVDDAWTEFEEKHGALAEAIGEYNGVVTEVASWRDDIVGAMEEYQGERSDRWQEDRK